MAMIPKRIQTGALRSSREALRMQKKRAGLSCLAWFLFCTSVHSPWAEKQCSNAEEGHQAQLRGSQQWGLQHYLSSVSLHFLICPVGSTRHLTGLEVGCQKYLSKTDTRKWGLML